MAGRLPLCTTVVSAKSQHTHEALSVAECPANHARRALTEGESKSLQRSLLTVLWWMQDIDLDSSVEGGMKKLIDAAGAGASFTSPGWLTQLGRLWGGKSVRRALALLSSVFFLII